MYKTQKGFGLVEVLIALTISMFAFLAFYSVMSKSISVAGMATAQSDMTFLVDNRIQYYLITGDFDMSNTPSFDFSIQENSTVVVTDQRHGLSKTIVLGDH